MSVFLHELVVYLMVFLACLLNNFKTSLSPQHIHTYNNVCLCLCLGCVSCVLEQWIYHIWVYWSMRMDLWVLKCKIASLCVCAEYRVSKEFLVKEKKWLSHYFACLYVQNSNFLIVHWRISRLKKISFEKIFQMVSSMILGSKNILNQDDVLLKMFDFSSVSIWPILNLCIDVFSLALLSSCYYFFCCVDISINSNMN